MTNRSKNVGTAAESKVVTALRGNGFPGAERRALAGNLDKGDIAGIGPVCIEVKACKTQAIPQWLRETEAERVNAGADIGVVWHKLRGSTDPLAWAVTMTGQQFLNLLRDAGHGDPR